MMRVMKEVLISILAFGLIFSGLSGCTNSVVGNGDDDQPPELPPSSSMTMDFSAFGGDKLAPSKAMAGKNFMAAAGRVLLLNVGVIVVLGPPVAFFKTAETTRPIRKPDGSWHWNYTVNFLAQKHEVELIGRLKAFKTEWSILITRPSGNIPLDEFEWYYGEAALNNQSGSWRFFDPANPDAGKEVAAIDWSVQALDEGEIKFTNTNRQVEGFGDVLTYSIKGTTASISFFDASANLTADIEWDIVTVAGSIKVPDYNNGERAYWDEDLQDVER